MNRNILVVTDNLLGYETLLKPYLDFFGFTYKEVCINDVCDCALVIANADALKNDKVAGAVANGAGAVLFADGCGYKAESIFVSESHYITALHDKDEKRELYSPLEVSGKSAISGEVLVRVGDAPLLEISGKVALWHSMKWMSHDILGPIHGMDDILWRSIVWAAKKPFVMQGMPPMLGMRVDDVWGAWSEFTPENPLSWIETANKYGIKPWLGVFTDNIDDMSTEKVREYVKDGRATAFPHAFAGCEWVDSELPEHWIYLNHNDGPYSDEQMAENAARAKAWFDDNDVEMSKYALGHYYETAKNAIPHLKEWGCEFIGIHMDFDVPYRASDKWIKAGPYRNGECDIEDVKKRPVYYGDYVCDGQLFNCVTEIRDVCGYEWAPTGMVKSTIANGITQLRRAIDSMCPAVLFTHESCWIQRISPKRWDKILAGVMAGIEQYDVEHLTMDEICRYARAKHDVKFVSSEVCGDKIKLALSGKNDMATKCYVFDEKSGEITQRLADIPRVDGDCEIEL